MSRPRDALDLLARSRPARLDLPPDRVSDYDLAVSAIVTSEAPAAGQARARLGRTRRAALMSVGVTAAVAAAVVAGVAVAPRDAAPGTDATSAPQPASGDAGQLLLAAAERNVTTPLTGGRYLNLQAESGVAMPVAAAAGSYTMVQRSLHQYWLARAGAGRSLVTTQSLGATPATPADGTAWRRAGSPSVVKVTKPKPAELRTTPGKVYGNTVDQAKLFGVGNRLLTLADLDQLPTDPAALREMLLRDFDGGGGDVPTDRNHWLFGAAASVLTDLPVSNAVRAAAFRLLAELPGVRALGAVRDLRGRAGQAVAFVQDSPVLGSFEVRLIIDPDTGHALGQERRAVRPRGPWSWLEPGAISTYQLVLVSEATDDNPPKVDVTD